MAGWVQIGGRLAPLEVTRQLPRQRRPKDSSLVLPLLPRRRGVLFPYTSGPILVGRRSSLRAIDDATNGDGRVAVVTQRDPTLTEIGQNDIFGYATEAEIGRALRLPDGTTQVWVQGYRRLRIVELITGGPYYRLRCVPIEEPREASVQTEALRRAVLALFEKVVRLAPSASEETYVMALIDVPNMLSPAAHHTTLRLPRKKVAVSRSRRVK